MRRSLVFIWCIAAIVMGAAILQPVGVHGQLLLGALVIAALLTIRALKLDGIWRHIFIIMGTVLVFRYVYWRTTSTLPPISPLIDFIPGIIVYAAEMFCVAILAMNLFVIAQPIDRPRARRLTEGEAPTVDVFIPTYNEDVSLLAGTLSAALAMDYPRSRLSVYLLDDGGTDEKVGSSDPDVALAAGQRRAALQRLCADMGAHYITRPRNVSAKAGNLSHALAYTRGDLIAVFDADHAPERGFLRETVSHFLDDEKLFLVQTPHFFLNPDPIEKNLSTFSRMPSENEMFYGLIQKGLDKWNATFFCGSAALLRRTALEEAGGFSGISITEDAETALAIHSRGWHSLYVDKPLIAGLQPETFASFIGQRSRWCRGMIQILILKNPLVQKGLTAAQRLCYLTSCAYWLFPIPRLIFLVAPLLYLFFDLRFFIATTEEFVAYTVVYLVAALIMQNYSYGRFRWPWVSELYEYVQSIYLFPAILSVIRDPRKPKFNVTAKGETSDDDFLSVLALPYFIIFLVLLGGFGVTVWRITTAPDETGLLLIVGFWNLLNLLLAAIALGIVSERRERRLMQRMPAEAQGMLSLEGQTVPVSIVDVSLGGALLKLHAPMKYQVGGQSTALLTLDVERPPIEAKLANGRTIGDRRFVGLSFTDLRAADYGTLSALMYRDLSDLRRRRTKRQSRRGISMASLQLLVWSIRHSLRGAYFAVFKRRSAITTSS